MRGKGPWHCGDSNVPALPRTLYDIRPTRNTVMSHSLTIQGLKDDPGQSYRMFWCLDSCTCSWYATKRGYWIISKPRKHLQAQAPLDWLTEMPTKGFMWKVDSPRDFHASSTDVIRLYPDPCLDVTIRHRLNDSNWHFLMVTIHFAIFNGRNEKSNKIWI
jgi:hypothetical protein